MNSHSLIERLRIAASIVGALLWSGWAASAMDASVYGGGVGGAVSVVLRETGGSMTVVVSEAGAIGMPTADGRFIRHIPGEGRVAVRGYPDLPAVARWVRVPERGAIEVEVSVSGERFEPGAPPPAYFEPEDKVCVAADINGVWPPHPAEVSAPMVMRGVRMVVVKTYPVRWDARRQGYVLADRIEVTLTTSREAGANEVPVGVRPPSRGFDILAEHLLLNPPRRDESNQTYRPGGIVVVVNEDAPEEVEEFVHWKRQLGHPTQLMRVPGGISARDLRDALREIYNDGLDAGKPFEFLILMGQNEADEELILPFDNQFHDIYFGQLEGDDMLPDVAVGTFDCYTVDNLICAIRRAIGYQSGSGGGDDEWFTRAGVGVGHCSVPQDHSPSHTGKWAAALLRRTGFEDVRTHFWSDTEEDNFSPMVADLYNDGANFILVRGHQSDFTENDIEVGDVFPFHFLTSSATIRDRGQGGAFSRAFHMGTPDAMRGPSAGFGHYSSPRTNVANALAGGLMQSLFIFDIGSLGWARNYAVANLARVMVADGEQLMPYYYSHWRFFGDPAQWVWMGAPPIAVAVLPIDQERLERDATELVVMALTDDGELVDDVLVSLYDPTADDFLVTAHTDADGRAFLVWEHTEIAGDELILTGSGTGMRAGTGRIEVAESAQYVAVTGWEFNDIDGGNDDGAPNPGEFGRLSVELTNTGDAATGEFLMTEVWNWSQWCDVEFQRHGVQSLPPGESRTVDLGGLEVSPGAPDGEPLPLRVTLVHPGDEWRNTVGVAPVCTAAEPTIFETFGELAAGEVREIRFALLNRGGIGHNELSARLSSLTPFAVIQAGRGRFPPADRGRVAVQDERTPFRIQVAPNVIPGRRIEFSLSLEGEPGVIREIEFALPVGVAGQGDPLGPDNYGYIALDDADEDLEGIEAPVYDWVEICPWRDDRDFDGETLPIQFGGEADSTVVIDLPFNFRFYGRDYRQISVCSNGWVAVGDQTDLKNQQNWPLPGFNGAFGMLAVFWDRLEYTMRSDGLFGFYDRDGGRYIIEWLAGVRNNGNRADEGFQLIIYDPQVHPAPSGDSPFLYQYQTVNNVQDQWEANAHCSVGITSPDGRDGLTYTYWDQYPEPAARLQNARAILWTTELRGERMARVTGRVTRFIDSTGVALAWVRAVGDGLEAEAMTNDQGRFNLVIPTGVWDITAGKERYGEAAPPGGGRLVIEEGDSAEIHLEDIVLPHLWLAGVPEDTLILLMASVADTTVVLNLRDVGNLEAGLEAISEITPDSIAFMVEVSDDTVDIAPGGEAEITLNIGARGGPGLWILRVNFHTNTPQRTLTWVIVLDAWSSVAGDAPSPLAFVLREVFPNPFNSSATVRFDVPNPSRINLVLYDLQGRLIQRVAAGDFQAGAHSAVLDGADLPAGVYLMRLQADDKAMTRKAVIVK